MEKYLCIKSKTNDTFGVGIYGNFTTWKKQALDWAHSEELKKDIKKINNEKILIDFISDFWNLKIISIPEDTQKTIEKILKDYKKIYNNKNHTTAADFIEEIILFLNNFFVEV